MAQGDKLNSTGGSFLPKDDDFFQGAAAARARKTASIPTDPAQPKVQKAAPAAPAFTPPNANGDVFPLEVPPTEEDASARLGRSTEPLNVGMNGVPDMQGGLPDIFKKEAAALGLVLTEDDVMQYVYRGSVSKEIPVIKNLLSVKMRTITSKEISDINLRMSEELKARPDMISKEYSNKNTMYLFAYAIEAMGKPGALRTLPADYSARLEQVLGLAPQVVAKLSHRYNLLEFLLQDRLSDEEFIKN